MYKRQILTYGGAVRALTVPDREGNPVDVALGFDTLADYRKQDKYIGALVGRYANRIGGASFTLGGTEYRLAANNGPNHLHGGLAGFDKQVWKIEEQTDSALTLSLYSTDGQEGYPGNLDVRVTYTLTEEGLSIDYVAQCDRDTPVSYTHLDVYKRQVGAVAFVLAACFPQQLISIFGAANESSYYTSFAIQAFRTYLCMIVLACVNKACVIFLQAMGKAAASTALSMIREVVFGVGFALLLPVFFGLDGVLISMPVSDVLTFAVAVFLICRTYRELNTPACIAAANRL